MPEATLTAQPMRVCAWCTGTFLAHSTRNWSDPYFCPKCRPKLMDGFDPQPNDPVRHIDRPTGPWSNLFVVTRDDDQVVVQPIGYPERRHTVHLGELMPASMPLRSQR